MDPMELAEEERRLKEEAEVKELFDTVVLDSQYFSSRNFSGKGREVHPSGKQRKEVQTIGQSLKIAPSNRRKSAGDTPDETDIPTDFDLQDKPRIFVSSGFINKKDPDKLIRYLSNVKRFLFLFNDLLLITIKKDNAEIYELQQVLYVKDMRIRHNLGETEEEKFGFELVVRKNRGKSTIVFHFSCDNEESKRIWIRDLEDTLLAYHNETELTKKLGWFHNIILGTFHSAAFTGDHVLLRRHLKLLPLRGVSIDTLDKTGMSPLHWATLKGYEVCVRLLLDRGADVDILQKGHNTPLLLAAAAGHDTICRLLIDRGAAVRARNHRDHDAVFMAVVYGHSSKGLPWTLQLLHAKGLDLNQSDNVGATPLHYCAQRNLARPVRMLVDSGANVNAIHGTTQLTPLQMACSNAHPDVETIRSFLDKGAYPNWKDIQGRTAFDFAMRSNQPIMKAMPGSRMSTNISEGESKIDVSSLLLATENEDDIEEAQARGQTTKSGRWRPMEGTIQQVGDWAVKALPALLELSKKGAKFQKNDLDLLRPSFRAAVLEAHKVWKDKESPPNFLEFVLVREQSGEDLILNKGDWIKDKSSTNCQLCSDAFGITNRRHHCRACGVLVCDDCSSKKLQLKAYISNDYNYSSVTNSAEKKPKDFDSLERVCDGCFNRLCHEAIQPSPDHFRVKALKQCAYDLIFGIQDLVDSLEDPDGDPNNFGSSVRETMSLTKELDNLFPRSTNGNGPNSNPTSPLTRGSLAAIKSSSASFSMNTPLLSAVMPRKTQSMMSLKEGATNVAVSVSEDGMSDPLKLREEKLHRTEELIAKFTEAADGYHRIAKKLLEQKAAKSRLWGANPNID